MGRPCLTIFHPSEILLSGKVRKSDAPNEAEASRNHDHLSSNRRALAFATIEHDPEKNGSHGSPKGVVPVISQSEAPFVNLGILVHSTYLYLAVGGSGKSAIA